MFGYVKIHKPPLACGDYDQYRGVYCSLCRALGRRYGPLARLALNYDMTFYALLALSREEGAFRRGRCALNPLKRCLYCRGGEEALALAADVSMLMSYYHWRDKMEDGGVWARLLWAILGLFFLYVGYRARKRAPVAERIIRTAVTAQRLVEQDAAPSLDRCCHPSAHALGALCALLDEKYYRLGYLLGRWVYLADAADDYAGDIRRGRFNAFAAAGSDPEQSLRVTAAELERALEPLECARFRPILENILSLGTQAVQESILRKKEAAHEKPV